MTDNELLQAIEEYNAAEHAQEERLSAIFREMRDRAGGGRYVLFGNGCKWGVNDFQPMDEVFSLPRHVGSMLKFITGYRLD